MINRNRIMINVQYTHTNYLILQLQVGLGVFKQYLKFDKRPSLLSRVTGRRLLVYNGVYRAKPSLFL